MRNHVIFGTLQNSLNKHDPVVTLTSQICPHGDPAGPLNLFRYLRANLNYFKLNQYPTGALLPYGYNIATTPQQGP